MASLIMDNSEFYSNKCVEAANNRITSWLKASSSKYIIDKPKIDVEKIIDVGPNVFLVPSESQAGLYYIVDMQSRSCSCPQGRLLGPCKHKSLVAVEKKLETFDIVPTSSPTTRQTYWYIGTGKIKPLDWFLPLHLQSDLKVIDEIIEVSAVEPETAVSMDELMTGDTLTAAVNLNPSEKDNDGEEGIENSESEFAAGLEVKENLKNILANLEKKLLGRIDGDLAGYKKAVAVFGKSVDRLPASSDSALQKSLFSFAKTVTQVWIFIQGIVALI